MFVFGLNNLFGAIIFDSDWLINLLNWSLLIVKHFRIILFIYFNLFYCWIINCFVNWNLLIFSRDIFSIIFWNNWYLFYCDFRFLNWYNLSNILWTILLNFNILFIRWRSISFLFFIFFVLDFSSFFNIRFDFN